MLFINGANSQAQTIHFRANALKKASNFVHLL
jgi:hypothetical protein